MHYIISPLEGMKEKIETPLANLSEFMRQFNITYTSYYNRSYNRVGHLYQGKYKSILIQKESYLNILSRYIHLNPVRVEKMKNASTSEKKKYLRKNEKEIPSLRKIHSYCSKDKVIKMVCREIGKNLEQIKNCQGTNRQILMEMLYCYAGLKGREIGKIMGLDYSTVSVGRKRLRRKMLDDISLQDLVRKIKIACQ